MDYLVKMNYGLRRPGVRILIRYNSSRSQWGAYVRHLRCLQFTQ